MDNLRKAAEMALKLLENNRLRTDEHLIPIVVDDLRNALAQDEQEPVWCGCGDGIVANDEAKCGVCVMRLENQIERLKAQPEQESTQEHESRITGLEIRVAKLENPITDHEKLLFIGLDSNGNVVAEDSEGWLIKYRNTGIFMAPKKRTVWVNLYKFFYTKENADAADTISDRQRIGGKAYPVEIEE